MTARLFAPPPGFIDRLPSQATASLWALLAAFGTILCLALLRANH